MCVALVPATGGVLNRRLGRTWRTVLECKNCFLVLLLIASVERDAIGCDQCMHHGFIPSLFSSYHRRTGVKCYAAATNQLGSQGAASHKLWSESDP